MPSSHGGFSGDANGNGQPGSARSARPSPSLSSPSSQAIPASCSDPSIALVQPGSSGWSTSPSPSSSMPFWHSPTSDGAEGAAQPGSDGSSTTPSASLSTPATGWCFAVARRSRGGRFAAAARHTATSAGATFETAAWTSRCAPAPNLRTRSRRQAGPAPIAASGRTRRAGATTDRAGSSACSPASPPTPPGARARSGRAGSRRGRAPRRRGSW